MKRGRLTPTLQVTIAAVALWLLAIAGISQASAAQLTVNTPGSVAFLPLSRCADALLATTAAGAPTGGDYTEVAVSNIPGDCQGLPMDVQVIGSGGVVLASGAHTPTSATTTVTTGSYAGADVTTVIARIDGWVFPTAWTSPVPPPDSAISCQAVNPAGKLTGQDCTVTVIDTTYWDANSAYNYLQIEFDVDTGQNRYEVMIDYSDPSWPGGGFTPVYVGSGYNIINAPGYSCSELPIHRSWKAAGDVAWENSGVIFATDDPNYTNGTTPLCQ